MIAALQSEENSEPKNAYSMAYQVLINEIESKAPYQSLNRSQTVDPLDFYIAAPTGEIQRI